MKTRHLYWLFHVLLPCAGVVHAQAACPPGMIPYGTGQGQNMCGPDDSQQSSLPKPPPPRWIQLSGAIAVDSKKGVFGTVGSMDNQAIAENTAIMDCRGNGGSNCEIVRSYTNACAAIVTGDEWYVVTVNTTLNEAIQSGMDTCTKNKVRGCRVYYSECSLPIDVQKRLLSIPVP